jgi:4'-phosphopantetheinyl transferase
LSQYLQIAPRAINFDYGRNGKPRLVNRQGLTFNISKSGELLLAAFTAGCEIGIDLERIRAFPESDRIATLLFCRDEIADLFSLSPSSRQRAFFLCWTRKEAYVKAVGDGLSVPLNSFSVTLKPDQPAAFLHFGYDCAVVNEWRLHDLQLGHLWAAALAYKGASRLIHIFGALAVPDLLQMLVALKS